MNLAGQGVPGGLGAWLRRTGLSSVPETPKDIIRGPLSFGV